MSPDGGARGGVSGSPVHPPASTTPTEEDQSLLSTRAASPGEGAAPLASRLSLSDGGTAVTIGGAADKIVAEIEARQHRH